MNLNLDRLQALAEAATPGPWFFDTYSKVWPEVSSDDTEPLVQAYDIICGDTASPQGMSDCEFIASMNPVTALALIRIARAAKDLPSISLCGNYELEDALQALEDTP